MPPRKRQSEPRRSSRTRTPQRSTEEVSGKRRKLSPKHSSVERPQRRKLSPKYSSVERPRFQKKSIDGRTIDGFCWICHLRGQDEICAQCPRVYHISCLNQECLEFTNSGICPECQNLTVDGGPPVEIDRSTLKILLNYAISQTLKEDAKRHLLKSKPATAENSKYVRIFKSSPVFHHGHEDLVHLVDFEYLIDKVNEELAYGSTGRFFAEIKWIYHNYRILYGENSDLTELAQKLLRNFKLELLDIEACAECYERLHCSESIMDQSYNSFSQVCSEPHIIVWAKLRGSPYWPAKCLTIRNGQADVRFFGTHDRANLALSQCYKLSQKSPNAKEIKQVKYREALSELSAYINNYKVNYTSFPYAPFRTPLGENSQILPIRHNKKGRQWMNDDSLDVHTNGLIARAEMNKGNLGTTSMSFTPHPISNIRTTNSVFSEEPCGVTCQSQMREELSSVPVDQGGPFVHMTFSADETYLVNNTSDLPTISATQTLPQTCDASTSTVMPDTNFSNQQPGQEKPTINANSLPAKSKELAKNLLSLLNNTTPNANSAIQEILNSLAMDSGQSCAPLLSGMYDNENVPPNSQESAADAGSLHENFPSNRKGLNSFIDLEELLALDETSDVHFVKEVKLTQDRRMDKVWHEISLLKDDNGKAKCENLKDRLQKAQKCLPAISQIILSYWPESTKECIEQGNTLLQLWAVKMWAYLMLSVPRHSTSRFGELYKNSMKENNRLQRRIEELETDNRRCRRELTSFRTRDSKRFRSIQKLLDSLKFIKDKREKEKAEGISQDDDDEWTAKEAFYQQQLEDKEAELQQTNAELEKLKNKKKVLEDEFKQKTEQLENSGKSIISVADQSTLTDVWEKPVATEIQTKIQTFDHATETESASPSVDAETQVAFKTFDQNTETDPLMFLADSGMQTEQVCQDMVSAIENVLGAETVEAILMTEEDKIILPKIQLSCSTSDGIERFCFCCPKLAVIHCCVDRSYCSLGCLLAELMSHYENCTYARDILGQMVSCLKTNESIGVYCQSTTIEQSEEFEILDEYISNDSSNASADTEAVVDSEKGLLDYVATDSNLAALHDLVNKDTSELGISSTFPEIPAAEVETEKIEADSSTVPSTKKSRRSTTLVNRRPNKKVQKQKKESSKPIKRRKKTK